MHIAPVRRLVLVIFNLIHLHMFFSLHYFFIP
jgi:hypothetical protein